MTQRKHFTRGLRVIARVVKQKAGSGSWRGNLVLLPELPIGRKEIGRFEGLSLQTIAVGRCFGPTVTADRSIPAVGGDFNRSSHPVHLLRATLVSNRDIFGTPCHFHILQMLPHLRCLKKLRLVLEFWAVNVHPRTTSRSS